ncbi:hypothetical protein PGTUg99_021851 [Puccinia graminis f. sp. tritici]|uniref:Uncharacterized protein n=1 Tax=Puccinia graminis f. sp. tritici TaxID=56615 RepID=A0A5B0R6A4_PUCGR|nr:hypothetical protein PGTUg99_021851 [Puccinia graminis f. sp. tritici]
MSWPQDQLITASASARCCFLQALEAKYLDSLMIAERTMLACGDCNHLAKPGKIGDPPVPVMMRPGQTSSRRYTVRRPIDSAPVSLQGVSASPA